MLEKNIVIPFMIVFLKHHSTDAQSFKNKNKCKPPDFDLTGTKGNLYSLIISTYFFSE